MPIPPKQILEEIEQDFNSTELNMIYDMMQDIDYKLRSEFKSNHNVWFDRRVKILTEIMKSYEEVGWKVKIYENNLIFEQK